MIVSSLVGHDEVHFERQCFGDGLRSRIGTLALRVFSPIPTIGLVPLAILWFGLGENSKTLVIALGVFVPVWISSHAGLASTPSDYLIVVAEMTGMTSGIGYRISQAQLFS